MLWVVVWDLKGEGATVSGKSDTLHAKSLTQAKLLTSVVITHNVYIPHHLKPQLWQHKYNDQCQDP
jgi:hypothetical protein